MVDGGGANDPPPCPLRLPFLPPFPTARPHRPSTGRLLTPRTRESPAAQTLGVRRRPLTPRVAAPDLGPPPAQRVARPTDPRRVTRHVRCSCAAGMTTSSPLGTDATSG